MARHRTKACGALVGDVLDSAEVNPYFTFMRRSYANTWFYAVLAVVTWDFAHLPRVQAVCIALTLVALGLAFGTGHPWWGWVLGAFVGLSWRKQARRRAR